VVVVMPEMGSTRVKNKKKQQSTGGSGDGGDGGDGALKELTKQ